MKRKSKIIIKIVNFKNHTTKYLNENDITINNDNTFSFKDADNIPIKDEEEMIVEYTQSYQTGGYNISLKNYE